MQKLLSFLFIYSEIINVKCVWLRCVVSMKCEYAEAQQIWYTHRPFKFTFVYIHITNVACDTSKRTHIHTPHNYTNTIYSAQDNARNHNNHQHLQPLMVCMAVKWNREIAIIWNLMLLSHTNWQCISWYLMRMMAVNFPKYNLQIEWMWRCDSRRTKWKITSVYIYTLNEPNWTKMTDWMAGCGWIASWLKIYVYDTFHLMNWNSYVLNVMAIVLLCEIIIFGFSLKYK